MYTILFLIVIFNLTPMAHNILNCLSNLKKKQQDITALDMGEQRIIMQLFTIHVGKVAISIDRESARGAAAHIMDHWRASSRDLLAQCVSMRLRVALEVTGYCGVGAPPGQAPCLSKHPRSGRNEWVWWVGHEEWVVRVVIKSGA